MTLVLCIPYTGYVPGQIIPLTIELDNNSNVAIEEVKIKLERVSKKKINISMFLFINVCFYFFCVRNYHLKQGTLVNKQNAVFPNLPNYVYKALTHMLLKHGLSK